MFSNVTSILLRNKQKTLYIGGIFGDLGPFREGALRALGPVRAFYPKRMLTINLNCLNTASRHGLGSGTASFLCGMCWLLQAALVELLSGIPSKHKTFG